MVEWLSKSFILFFCFNDTATTEIYTLSLHDALPICSSGSAPRSPTSIGPTSCASTRADRKSTRLNSSHSQTSYAVFCLKKKKNKLLEIFDGARYVEIQVKVQPVKPR